MEDSARRSHPTRRHSITRRVFVGGAGVALGGVAFGALSLGCEGSVDGTDGTDPTSPPPGDAGTGPLADGAPASGAPVWRPLPTIQFVAGVASTFSIAEYVSDPDGDELTITLDDTPLPAGVTYDAAAKQFVYDGAGPIATTSGHVLSADDGS